MQRAKPLPTELPEKVAQHFWAKIERKEPDQCWPWLGYKTRKGYGRYNIRSLGSVAPHRLAYSVTVGAVPTDKVMDHLCRNPSCVNPSHLEAVTTRENIIRGIGPAMLKERNASKTHCPAGHEYTPENTRLDKKKSRSCRACSKIYNKELAVRRKIARAHAKEASDAE